MGGTTIRRLATRKEKDASVQRIVILAADVSGALILSTQPSEVEFVFAWIEHAGVNLPDELPIQLSQFCWRLLTKFAISTRCASMSVLMAAFRHIVIRMSFAF